MAEAFLPYISYGLAISANDEQRWYEERAHHAHEAWEWAAFYYRQGRLSESFYWGGRAERLSGDASNVMLSYAMVALELGHYEICQPRFRFLRRRHNLREAALGEVWSCYRQGKEHRAARLLGCVLSRFYISDGLRAIAGHLAQRVQRPGWATLSNSGVLSVYAEGVVRLSLDGEVLGDVPSGQINLAAWKTNRPNCSWAAWRRLSVQVEGCHVLGSPFDIGALTQCDGVVTAKNGRVEGWLWYPAEPDFEPYLSVNNRRVAITLEKGDISSDERPLFRPWCFSLPFSSLPGRGGKVVDIRDTHGRLLRGAPLDPHIARILARERPIPVPFEPIMVGESPALADEKARLESASCAVVIPVYQHYDLTRFCLLSVLETVPAETVVIVVNDASPDRRITDFLTNLAQQKRIILRENTYNRGFPYSVNVGLSLCRGRDVVLLNSDTVVFEGWIERLQDWLGYSEVGTVTPLSNDGGLTSYPNVKKKNTLPSLEEARQLDQLCQRFDTVVETVNLPTGNGFCLAISASCLQKTGLMRDQLFAQGYAEENDFCLRATQHGFRHVAAPNVYVWHRGHASFQNGYYGLLERNLALLDALYPDYMQEVQAFEARDPLYERRRYLDEERLQASVGAGGSVVLIQHKIGGGVARAVRERAQSFIQQGRVALSVVPTEKGCALEVCGHEDAFPNLAYVLPREWDRLCQFLQRLKVSHLEWHHLAGHAPWIRELHQALEVPYDVFVHDHIWFCPRIALLTGDGHYCGEPSTIACQECIERWGHVLEKEITIPFLLARSACELTAARRVVAPSRDAARRLKRHINDIKNIDIKSLENDYLLLDATRAPAYYHHKRRIGVLGGISRWKGYDVLLDLGRYIQAHHLPLEVILIGNTADDDALMQAGVRVTGAYHEKDVLPLVRAEEIDLGFVPSVAPETWCYVLGWLWRAGLDVVSFDIGASAERIKNYGRGQVIPLGAPVSFLAHYLLNYQTTS